MSAITDTLDRVFDRLLFLPPQPPAPEVNIAEEVGEEEVVPATPGERAFSISLFISATRCTLQYVLLPIVLPLIGLTTDISLPWSFSSICWQSPCWCAVCATSGKHAIHVGLICSPFKCHSFHYSLCTGIRYLATIALK